MTAREFCYWLQGYFEIAGDSAFLGDSEVDLIKRHLNMVFVHEIDPSYPQAAKLDKIHNSAPQSPDKVLMRC